MSERVLAQHSRLRNAGLPVSTGLAQRTGCCIEHFEGCLDDAFKEAAQEAHDGGTAKWKTDLCKSNRKGGQQKMRDWKRATRAAQDGTDLPSPA